MPYVPQAIRDCLASLEHEIADYPARTPGELNYLVTLICLNYLRTGITYPRLNDIRGVLGMVWDEIHDRIYSGYEENKREANGDIDLFDDLESSVYRA